MNLHSEESRCLCSLLWLISVSVCSVTHPSLRVSTVLSLLVQSRVLSCGCTRMYPFVCWWTLELLPIFDYFKDSCCQRLRTSLCVDICLDQQGWIIWEVEVPLCKNQLLPKVVVPFCSPTIMVESSSHSTRS